jgi:hypothetical protein
MEEGEAVILQLESKIGALEELVAARDEEITAILHQECGLDEKETLRQMDIMNKWRTKAFALIVSEKGKTIENMRHTRLQQTQV